MYHHLNQTRQFFGLGVFLRSVSGSNCVWSTDGVNWFASNLIPSGSYAPIAFDAVDQCFYCVSANGTNTYCYVSFDGKNWTLRSTQTNAIALNLKAGTYAGFVTDANGCMDSVLAITMKEPATAVKATASAIRSARSRGPTVPAGNCPSSAPPSRSARATPRWCASVPDRWISEM